MLDPIVAFFTRVFQWIGRGIGLLIGILLWPFMWFGRWYLQKGWILKGIVGLLLAGLVVFYAYFIWQTQRWSNFDPDYPKALLEQQQVSVVQFVKSDRWKVGLV